jgi:signal peptidase I
MLVLGAVLALAVPVTGIVTGRWRLQPILSGSMSPKIPSGALVLATPQRPSAIRVGQVVAYHAPIPGHRLIAHRVVAVLAYGRRPVIVTKGDANTVADPWHARIAGTQICVVRYSVPVLGSVTLFVQRTWPLLTLALLVAVALTTALRRVWTRPVDVTGVQGDVVTHP